MITRIIVDILLLLSILYANFWISLIVIVAGLFYFKNYYEVIGAGIIIDILYGIPLAKYLQIPFITTIAFGALYFMIGKIKQYIR